MDRPVHVAATPDKAVVLTAAARRVRATRSLGLAEDAEEDFVFHYYPEEEVLQWVVARDFRCFSPGSAFFFPELERQWRDRPWSDGTDLPVITPSSFASSPIVFLMSPAVAAGVGAVDRGLGWADLFDPTRPLRFMHAHARSGDGLAVVTAAYNAGLKELGATSLDDAGPALDRLMAGVQERIVEYGPDDATVIDRAAAGGDWRADVVLVQERSALAALARHPGLHAVLVHPEGDSSWVDQEICLVEPTATSLERESSGALVEALRSPEMAGVLRGEGWRPLGAELGTATDTAQLMEAQPTSVTERVGVIGAATPPAAQMPPRLVRVLRNRWSETKRAAEVCLVIDVSGSMSGSKLAAAERGAEGFLDRLEGADPHISLVAFADSAQVLVPLSSLHPVRSDVVDRLRRLQGGGQTALLDGVDRALTLLQSGDPAHLKAIVLLTDGEENNSTISLPALEERLRGCGCLFFAIGYGQGADVALLDRLAGATGGHSAASDEYHVDKIYGALTAHL
ncbi:VWA domain-containing protein [Geodermatophilus sp. CPCC 205761]|uniref:vWA domain-containing protein n=1 Tax=Geodermatophilus sp. CPCC 205761 TaxID=2936597 RepID=UPI003F531909